MPVGARGRLFIERTFNDAAFSTLFLSFLNDWNEAKRLNVWNYWNEPVSVSMIASVVKQEDALVRPGKVKFRESRIIADLQISKIL